MRPFLPCIPLLALGLSSCGAADDPAQITARDPVGVCSIGKAAGTSVLGLATYDESLARVPTGPESPGSRAVTVTCLTPGQQGTLLLLTLPHLRDGHPADTGRYTVRPCEPERCEAGADPRTAWAEAELPAAVPGRYVGAGGTLHVRVEEAGVIEGSYQIAFDRAKEVDARYPAEQVLWGSFRAPVRTSARKP